MAAMARVRGDAPVGFGVRGFDARPTISMMLRRRGRSKVITSTQPECFGHTKCQPVCQRQQQLRSDDHARNSRDGHANGRDDGFR